MTAGKSHDLSAQVTSVPHVSQRVCAERKNKIQAPIIDTQIGPIEIKKATCPIGQVCILATCPKH